MIADKDLLSIQQARILLENAKIAQKKLAEFSQEKLDVIFEGVLIEVSKHVQSLAIMSHEETGYGRWQDKLVKNRFVCEQVATALREMRLVGILSKDKQTKVMEVGVPLGVVVSLVSAMSPISTTIYNVLLAIKSGNALVFSLHPRAAKSMQYVLDIMITAAHAHGLPKGCLSYLETITQGGTETLFKHPATSLIMISSVFGMLQTAIASGKPFIFGGTGNGPVFIERTANIEKAVQDIITSKTFDNGIAPSAEQSLVLDAKIAQQARDLLVAKGAYFMSDAEADKLATILFSCDRKRNKETVGMSVNDLAKKAQFTIPAQTTLLIVDRKYVRDIDPYSKELLAPVLTCYTEDDWQNACEKCIELLIVEGNSHTLTIHSNDENVIEQFALKKPVARLLVNTPAAFGGMGFSTNLFPALTLGSGTSGYGITSDNVTPMHLTYIRKVAYGVRNITHENDHHTSNQIENDESDRMQILRKVLHKAITALDTSRMN